MRDTLVKILVFLVLFFFGSIITAGGVVLVAVLQGYPPAEILGLLEAGGKNLPSGLIRHMVWLQTIGTFIIPAIAFGFIYYRKSFMRYFALDRTPDLITIAISCAIILASYPLVQLAYELNQMIPISEWMVQMEDQAMTMMDEILLVDSFGNFLSTLIIVAVLPAIGEELVFRGIAQKQLGALMKSETLGIWLAAIFFSAIHLQFEGFLPRLLLGAILGYLYHWTKTLWIPILVHFFNNGIQVLILYMTDVDLSAIDETSTDSIPWWGTLISGIVLIALSYRLIQMQKSSEQ